ncbi:metallophosphoesterase [Deinococcus sp.]|uniref:metallophosphoesterase n=1 Tax=Deinococcus sp. TaxID=47478 RepID=UPI003CC566CF
MSDLWAIGDIHGELSTLRTLLQRARLTDFEDNWLGDGATLVFLGDLLDRGPDGAGVLHLARHLERQAAETGGRIVSLLGNHEVMLLAALRFRGPAHRIPGFLTSGLFEYWRQNGGQPRDLALLEPDDLEWLTARPALYRHADWLFCHADSAMYLDLGRDHEQVAQRVQALLTSGHSESWIEFLNAFAEREGYLGAQGPERADEMLGVFGGLKLAHGHTPVFVLQNVPSSPYVSPYLYANGKVLGLDSAMAYQKGAGFMVKLDADPGRLERPDATGVLESIYLTDILSAT